MGSLDTDSGTGISSSSSSSATAEAALLRVGIMCVCAWWSGWVEAMVEVVIAGGWKVKVWVEPLAAEQLLVDPDACERVKRSAVSTFLIRQFTINCRLRWILRPRGGL
jgi:hypothetical protein